MRGNPCRLGAWTVVVLAWSSASCAVRLDDLPEPTPDTTSEPPMVKACVLFSSEPQSGVFGPTASVPLSNGTALWLTEAIERSGERIERAGFLLNPGADPCDQVPVVLDELIPSQTENTLQALDGVADRGQIWLSFGEQESAPDAPFGIRTAGYGIAMSDDELPGFTPSELLWAGDRPSYGSTLVEHEGMLYAYGCRPTGFLSGECLVARASIDQATERGAWTYYQGSEHWAADVDDAWPIVEASTAIDVVYDPSRRRFIMVYVPVLGDRIIVRSGLGPTGPWSKAYETVRCAMPSDPEAFCYGARAHPDVGAGELKISYAFGSFNRQDGVDYRSRLITIGLPEELP